MLGLRPRGEAPKLGGGGAKPPITKEERLGMRVAQRGAGDAVGVAGLREEVAVALGAYRGRALRDLSGSWLVVDFDLAGLVVSDQAATYEGAEYGYMGEVGRVAKGYQFARAQLETPVGPYVL